MLKVTRRETILIKTGTQVHFPFLLENGVLVMSWGTRDVYVRFSPDGLGRRWAEPLLVFRGQGSGYTHLQALGPSLFRMVYDESAFDTGDESGEHRIVRVEAQSTP